MDSSVAFPAAIRDHPQYAAARDALTGHSRTLTGHSLAETYSLLTRVQVHGVVLDPTDAATHLRRNYLPPVGLPTPLLAGLPDLLADLRISGGAVYDALVGLAAREAGLPLVTRDGRALATYAALGVRVELIPSR